MKPLYTKNAGPPLVKVKWMKGVDKLTLYVLSWGWGEVEVMEEAYVHRKSIRQIAPPRIPLPSDKHLCNIYYRHTVLRI
jgi:hypothetical protein